MDTKTYRAATMADAIAEVKHDLGRDAVILRTRRRRTGGLLKLFGGRRVWHVTAAGSDSAPAPKRHAQDHDGTYVPMRRPDDNATSAEPDTPEPSASVPREIAEIRKMVAALLARGGDDQNMPPAFQTCRDQLIEQDVAPELVDELMSACRHELTGQQLDDVAAVRSVIRRAIAARIRTAAAPTAGRQVIALVGPTGVGKTTTIAKLAATAKLRDNRRVGLVTLDTYRIAAVEQLKTYADIIEVPIHTCLGAGQLRQAVRRLADADLVLIDTAGRSHNDTLRLGELRRMLGGADADEIHLVVAATGSRACTRRVVERFAPLGANRICLTKLDEAETFGNVLNLAAACDAPLSYVTTGQDVPDDIAQADADDLARRIMGEDHRDA
ncbi:MAG: flagellar biosynthesis protein FlhF [Phycisphaerae bacterium]|nr:flagellar biosynthesis protein FlhF [Phycisphaerae bacterium]